MRDTSVRDFLAGEGATAMDSERFAAMSSSSFGSQMIRGTTGLTSVFGSVLAESESTAKSNLVLTAKKGAEEVEADGDTGVGANAFLVG
ncbi:hypothetical protein PVL29_017820 [Vitis rotundifolia]|uniref:Uncharacterized protein n=1 Tax=Vitis rotundifolia TaxID=103349 RepID=A0AA38Z3V0_VITRO|nr:hypothetical protein PVL29_017820 [Vitis rotundifolia]